MTAHKILHVCNDLEIGGVQRVIVDLLTAIDREDFTPAVALVCGDGPHQATLEARGISVRRFNCIRRPGNLKLIDPLEVLRLARWMRHSGFDLVQTHLFFGNTFGRIAARLAKVPSIIATEHNTYLDKSHLRRRVDRHLAKFSDPIVAVTRAVAEFTSRQERIPLNRFEVIRNGIDIDRYTLQPDLRAATRRQYGIPDKAIVVGSIGRFVPQKDFHLVMRSFQRFTNDFPESRLLLVGDGPLKKELESRSRELQLADRVIFTGFQFDIRPFLAAMDLFLLTPEFEGLGLVILEAMAAGIPVVAAIVGGIPEVIDSEKTGILVTNREPASFSAALSSLARNDSLKRELTTRASDRLRREFSLATMSAAYGELYLRTIARSRSKP